MDDTLYLPLKKEWFEMIERGEKTEEYRTIKPYWCNRLARCGHQMCWWRDANGECVFRRDLSCLNFPGYTKVRFSYGYTKRTMLFELDSIFIGKSIPELGAPLGKDVFILKLGKRIE